MEDDNDFRDLVLKSLENCGILQKIKAELRAHIYENVKDDITPIHNGSEEVTNLDSIDETTVTDSGSKENSIHLNSENLVLFLISDFLRSKNFPFTENVFRSEANLKRDTTLSESQRNDISEKFNLLDNRNGNQSNSSDTETESKQNNEKNLPILLQIVNKYFEEDAQKSSITTNT